MRGTVIALLILVFALIVIAGCSHSSDNITSKTVQETPKQEVQEPVDVKPAGCGDGKCVDSERCNEATYETVCPDDCPISCPPKMVVSEAGCIGECSTGGSGFVVTGNSKVKIRLENIGERATNTANTKFRCYEGETLVVHNDGEKKYGVEFRDYFDSYIESKSINSRITGSGNVVNYFLDFKFVDTLTRNADLSCTISIDDGTTDLQVRETVKINLRK